MASQKFEAVLRRNEMKIGRYPSACRWQYRSQTCRISNENINRLYNLALIWDKFCHLMLSNIWWSLIIVNVNGLDSIWRWGRWARSWRRWPRSSGRCFRASCWTGLTGFPAGGSTWKATRLWWIWQMIPRVFILKLIQSSVLHVASL